MPAGADHQQGLFRLRAAARGGHARVPSWGQGVDPDEQHDDNLGFEAAAPPGIRGSGGRDRRHPVRRCRRAPLRRSPITDRRRLRRSRYCRWGNRDSIFPGPRSSMRPAITCSMPAASWARCAGSGSPRRRCTARGCTSTPSARSPAAASFRASGASCGSWWRPCRMTPRRPQSPGCGSMEAAPSSQAPQLSWAAVRDAGGSGVAGYRISRDGRHIASTMRTSFVDYAAKSGVHVYTVSAYDRAGNVSGESAPQVAGRDTIAPATPAPAAESPTDSAPAISWDAVVDDGSGVELYQIRRDGRMVGSTAGNELHGRGSLERRLAHLRRARARPRRQRIPMVGSAGRALCAGRHRRHAARPAGLSGASRSTAARRRSPGTRRPTTPA